MTQVFWAARDLDGAPWGNHQFILIFLDSGQSMVRTPTQSEGGQSFVTFGGHIKDGNLVLIANQTADVASVKEVLNPATKTGWSDFDMERKSIDAPSGGTWSFAIKIEELAYKYEKNAAVNPVKYDLWDENCATWVNTLLKVAEVSETARRTAGEFSGIDWGEEDLLDESLFK